jgi:flavin-dependent dehydrogenase
MEAKSNEVIVVGAGLAGMTAALNLAREGKDVLVLERYDQVGGMPQVRPAIDVTPFDVGPVSKFIGVDLGAPQIVPCDKWNFYAFGTKVEMKVKEINLHCVERGPRKTALDKQLYDLCVEAGVKFEFGKDFISQHDFAQLPPDTIIATGLYPAGAFESFNIPYQKVFGYMGRGVTDDFPTCGVWMDDLILDYAYYGASNGAVFCLYFAREPVKESEFNRFVETQLEGEEGMHIQSWIYHEGLVPTAEYNTPRLFWGDKILAGTLAGGMDPFALFGVHGSLVTGKIAAIALSDKAAAFALFKKYTRFFNRNLFARKVFDATPVAIKKRIMGPQLQFSQNHMDKLGWAMNNFFKALPGYQELPR